MNRNCSVCNIKVDKNNYLKDRTVCKSCYNKKRGEIEIITSNQQPKNDHVNNNKSYVNNPKVSTYENQRHINIGPSHVGKTYYMLKVLEKTDNKNLFIY